MPVDVALEEKSLKTPKYFVDEMTDSERRNSGASFYVKNSISVFFENPDFSEGGALREGPPQDHATLHKGRRRNDTTDKIVNLPPLQF
jgi:hypothetical protein